MLRHLYFRTFYPSYLDSRHGIKAFAEHGLSRFICKVADRVAVSRELSESLLAEKANLQMVEGALTRQHVLDDGTFATVRRRLWTNTVLIAAILVSAVLVEYMALTAYLTLAPTSYNLGSWLIAVVLAVVLPGSGIVVTARLLEALHGIDALAPAAGSRRQAVWVWALVLAGLELAGAGVVAVRARLLAAEADDGLLGAAFVVYALLIPVLGGVLRWDVLRLIGAYKRTQARRLIETRLAQIDSLLRQHADYERSFFRKQCLQAWREVTAFMLVKARCDAERGTREDVSRHFARSFEAFQAEAVRRYEADLYGVVVPSFRRLQPPSYRLSARPKRRQRPLPLPAASASSSIHENPCVLFGNPPTEEPDALQRAHDPSVA